MEQDIHEAGASIFEGGPLHRLMVGTHEGTPRQDVFRRRAVICAVVAWVPLLLISLVEGTAFSTPSLQGFLADYAMHVRFLIALPLLITAEWTVRSRLGTLIHEFVGAGMVAQEDVREFDALVREARQMARSIPIEVVIVGVSYVFVVLRYSLVFNVGTWVMPQPGRFGIAAFWLLAISLPAFCFVACRWLYRCLIWTWLLWRLAKFKLNLIAIHPDRTAGLGFIARAPVAFTGVCFAIGLSMSSNNCVEVAYRHVSPASFKMSIIAYVVLLAAICQGPLLVFTRRLLETKTEGILVYGKFASTYVAEFERKWIDDDEKDRLGSGDIQSLADLGNSFRTVEEMKLFPVDRGSVTAVVIAAALPQLPLLLMTMPLSEILETLSRGLV